MTESNDNKSISLYVGLFLISLASLTSEILLIRIISLVFFFIIGYVVIGIALLGFGAAGSFLAVYPAFLQGNYRRRLTVLAAAFSVFTPIAYFISVTPAPYATGSKLLYYLLAISIVMTLHFFLAGLVISYVFTRRVWEIHRLYFVNLLGSGIGCFILIQLIRPLGGEGLILLVTFLGFLSVVFFAYEQSKKISMAALLAACGILFLFPYAKGIFHIHPTLSGKHMTMLMEHHPDAEIEFQAWDPVARVDAISLPGEYLRLPDRIPFKYATNDGSAGTFILGFEEDFSDVDFADSTWLGIPYWIKKNPEVLIVGLGGGIDVQTALHYEASKIYGVEISGKMIEMMRDHYKSFANYPYQHNTVQIIHDEGRSYIRRMEGKVDLIQMTGVDTFAGQYGGSAIMVENFLYTVESFKEYFDHLKEDGIFCIHRVTDSVHLKSGFRTSSLGVEALRQMGVEKPENHFVVISQGTILTTLMKKSPYTPEEIQTIEESLQKFRLDATIDPAPFLKGVMDAGLTQERQLLWKPGSSKENKYAEYFRAVQNHDEQSFFETYPFDISPCTDDKPFFFMFERWDRILRDGFRAIKLSPGFVILGFQFLWIGFMTLLLILLPLFLFHRRGLDTQHSKGYILYFACLGLGFMLLEIGFMQKFTLFLGHPTYSISVILFSLLVFSGLGSLTGGRLSISDRALILYSILTVVSIALVYRFLLDPLFHGCLTMTLPVRILISVLVVAPLGFFMGMPFPTGLRVVEKEALDFVPWAWAINGSFSVLATAAASLIAMAAGFSNLIFFAILVYLAGMLVMVSPGFGVLKDG